MNFYLVQVFRFITLSIGLVYLNTSIELGTNFFLLCLSIAFACFFGGEIAKRKISFLKAIIIFVLIFLSYKLVTAFSFNLIVNRDNIKHTVNAIRLEEHLTLIAIIFYGTLISTWLFWIAYNFLTLEITFVLFAIVYQLKSHRFFNTDEPKFISEIAWHYNIEPHDLIFYISFFFFITLNLYIYISSGRQIFSKKAEIISKKKRALGSAIAILATLSIILFTVGNKVKTSYVEHLEKKWNEVGQGKQEKGKSPLGFSSAVGKTKQPAALVRLESDYKDNPTAPMLYLRESALSEFNGNEYVFAGGQYDLDVPRIKPGEEFSTLENLNNSSRVKVTQSIYFLRQHDIPFAIDYPKAIRILKNPDPQKFTLAYQALSYAPSFQIESIIGENVGKKTWSEKYLSHYLRAPGSNSKNSIKDLSFNNDKKLADENNEDLRYKIIANNLTKDLTTPVQKAARIVSYLSKESIYTRSPGHQVNKDGDPVAAYLFSKEKKGYCVHFAHAAVHLMRLSGIPARIGTGYLTDLTYAKDGHVLLHLGDRHAWPEIYIESIGWIPFDVTPERAENEQAIIPNPDILEELISKIDPAQEFIDPLPEELNQSNKFEIPSYLSKRNLIKFLLFVLVLFIALKAWIRKSYLISKNSIKKHKRIYRSLLSELLDIGIERNWGETNLEFAQRTRKEKEILFSKLQKIKEITDFAPSEKREIEGKLNEAIDEYKKSYKENVSIKKSILSFFNPKSLNLIFKSLLIFLLLLNTSSKSVAQETNTSPLAVDVKNKSLEEILREAQMHYYTGSPIEARSMWLKAIEKDPNDYRAFLFLSAYYIDEESLFKLAFQNISKAKKLFLKKFGSDVSAYTKEQAFDHAQILYILSEVYLNLDLYDDSLNTLEEFEKYYWQPWLPGSKAWVLWKLKRIDEAIKISQLGLLRGAEPGRLYNVLGILFAAKGERKLAENAFSQSILAEVTQHGASQLATPLNNVGEVYNELFLDGLAEASWRKALTRPDGCEHILPSLNLARKYIEQLRLFQAERVLKDFEVCFAENSNRSDSEHRALLLLYQARIEFYKGNFDEAFKLFERSAALSQWFGKIGTTKEDMELANLQGKIIALRTKNNINKNSYHKGIINKVNNLKNTLKNKVELFWNQKKAREVGIDKLSSFEDIFIRNTDAMIEYANIAVFFTNSNTKSIEAFFKNWANNDQRKEAKNFYKLFLAEHYTQNGKYKLSNKLLNEIESRFNKQLRVIKAKILALKIINNNNSKSFIFSSNNEVYKEHIELFKFHPPSFKQYGIKLPVNFFLQNNSSEEKKVFKILSKYNFSNVDSKSRDDTFKFLININNKHLTLSFFNTNGKSVLIKKTIELNDNLDKGIEDFTKEIFSHSSDPSGEALPRLSILDGIIE